MCWLDRMISSCPTFRAWIAAFPDATRLTRKDGLKDYWWRRTHHFHSGTHVVVYLFVIYFCFCLFQPLSCVHTYFVTSFSFSLSPRFCCLNFYTLVFSCESHFVSSWLAEMLISPSFYVALKDFGKQGTTWEEREWVKGETDTVVEEKVGKKE